MNELGREYGKLFSTFTKWPASIGSDLHEMYRKGGITGGTYRMSEKYLAPLAMFAVLSQTMLDTEGSPRAKALLGQSVINWAPIMAVQGVAPPWLEAGKGMIESARKAVEADFDNGAAEYAEKTLKPMSKGFSGFVPMIYGISDGAIKAYETVTDNEWE